MPQLLTVQEPMTRLTRRPKHKFSLRVRPFQIQPFMIAPVLPGESMTSLYFESREVTDPLSSPLIGWKSEYYAFYVKIRDLNDRDTLDDLFTNPSASVSALNSALDIPTFHRGGSPNYTLLALQRVTETHFRDEGEPWNVQLIDTLPAAQLRDQGWMDSLTDAAVMPDGSALGDPSATSTPEALDALMDAFELLRANGLTTMSFNDYLVTAGVRVSREADHFPEMIWSCSEFTYPANTINPVDGAPSSAASWVVKKMDRAAKHFKEPGFLLGVHVVRPKVFMARQYGSLTHFLDKGLNWLLPIAQGMPEASLREFTGGAAGNGPLANGTVGTTNGYWVDMRDLFLYGDQFWNFAITPAEGGVALPTVTQRRKYLAAAEVDGFFKNVASNKVRSDGFASLSIRGNQVGHDNTGGHQADA